MIIVNLKNATGRFVPDLPQSFKFRSSGVKSKDGVKTPKLPNFKIPLVQEGCPEGTGCVLSCHREPPSLSKTISFLQRHSRENGNPVSLLKFPY